MMAVKPMTDPRGTSCSTRSSAGSARRPTAWIVGFAILFLWNAILADVPVRRCGSILHQDGARYVLEQDLVQEQGGDCLVITGKNIEFDGRGHRIVFRGVGIRLENVSQVRIHDVRFENAGYAGSGSWAALRKQAFPLSEVEIFQNEFNLHNDGPVDLYGIQWSNGTGPGIRIHHNTFAGTGSHRLTFLLIDWGENGGEVDHNVVTLDSTACDGRPKVFAGGGGRGVRLHDNEVTIGSPERLGLPCETQVFTFWHGEGHEYFDNEIIDYGGNTRMLHFDYTDGGRIYRNRVHMRGSDHDGTSQGVRIRYGVSGVEIFDNWIDADACTGRGCVPVSLCASNGAEQPIGMRIHHNTLFGREQLIRFEGGCGPDNLVHDNSLSVRPGGRIGAAYYFYQGQQRITGLELARNVIATAGEHDAVRFADGAAPQGWEPVVFCSESVDGRPLTDADITKSGAGAWTISEGPCSDEGGGGGSNTPPSPVLGLRRGDTSSPTEP
jgi:hypothetical protein